MTQTGVMVKKIFLVCDDYSEMMSLQADFKKVGFDVESVGNDQRLADQILSMNPDLILAIARTNLALAISVGTKLKESIKTDARVILMIPPGTKIPGFELGKLRMDLVMEDPVPREKLVGTIAKLLDLDPKALLAKLARGLSVAGSGEDGSKGAGFSDPERMKKYKPFLSLQIDKKATSHTRQALKEKQTELKKAWDFNWLGQLDQLKKQFARALFRRS